MLVAINKAKVVEAAQRFVAQGRLKEAIAEYERILKEDPKDLNTLNSVGDLFVRLNKTPEALQYFTRLADIYVSDGFLVRGIAMYKKISKLDPANTLAAERLAELYTMQGLFTEARSQYLQVAELHLKGKKTAEAMKILQKLLDLEPDNLQIQQRLAELYEEHGRKEEAASIYRRLAERLLQREESAEAQKWMAKAARLAPESPDVLLTRAKLLLEQGHAAEAIALLEKSPQLGEQPAGVELVLKCRLALGEWDRAVKLAEELFARDAKNFGALLAVAEKMVEQGQRDPAVAIFTRIAEPALQQPDRTRVIGLLSRLVESGAASAAEWLASAARQADDQDALATALGVLAGQAFDQRDFARARDLYQELVSILPEVPEYVQRLQQARERLGEAVQPPPVPAEPIAAAVPVVPAEPVEAPAAEAATPVTDEDLDPDTLAYVTSSLTDIDLFSSYGMNQKAIELAEQVVTRVPGHVVANERLLDFYLGSAQESRVPSVARRLEQLYRQKGDTDRADEMVQLAARYEEKFGVAAPQPAGEEVREVDLSAEWASVEEAVPVGETLLEMPAAVEFKADEVREEIEFYLSQGLLSEARVALDRYSEQFPAEPVLRTLRQKLEAAAAAAPAPTPTKEVAAPERAAVVEEEEELPAAAQTAPVGTAPEVPAAPAAPEEGYELALEEKQAGSMSADQFFSDLAGQLEAALPEEVAAQAPAERGAESAEGAATLAEVFDEFKQELGAAEETEDIETHYNLGIAFKEMGLLDEAISEFQKVHKAAEKQEAYPNLIQVCTLLGLCFMDKALPAIAVQWYERALKAPGLDPEGALALRYDMGLAHEQAGNKKAALDCFLEVYGLNVDFRDVSERIRALQQ